MTKWGKWNSCPPRTVRLATALVWSRINGSMTSQFSLYDMLYWTPAASSKQPVKDNGVVVSDWLPMSRMWHEKVSSGTFTCNEPIMYPKILKHDIPVLRLEFMVLSRFIMYYRVFIRRLYANGYVSFRPKFWSTGAAASFTSKFLKNI